MATQREAGHDKTFIANADLSARQFRAMVGIRVGTVTRVQAAGSTAIGERVIGILQNAPTAAGDEATVRHVGTAKVELGTGGIQANQLVKTADTGLGVHADTTGNIYFGLALEDGAAGDIVEVLLTHGVV